jgi:hypothetical protein
MLSSGCIRTSAHSYAVIEDGRCRLYDYFADPFQRNNLAGPYGTPGLMDHLDRIMMTWESSVGDHFPVASAAIEDIESTEVGQRGQRILVCAHSNDRFGAFPEPNARD